MKPVKSILFAIVCVYLLASCNNYFHDLIPSDDNYVLSFTVPRQIGSSVITPDSIYITVEGGTDVHSLLPIITVSPKATVIPVTLDYIRSAFPSTDIAREAINLYTTTDLAGYVWDLIERNDDFNIPPIEIEIDFTSPVNIFVIAASGSVRQYTVTVHEDDGQPHIFSFGFSKYENAELIRDSISSINTTAKTLQNTVLYPAEIDDLSYMLIPSFEIIGDYVEIDGVEIHSRLDAVQFAQNLGLQQKTVTVFRNGLRIDYDLLVIFEEDPDSIRSITDFRFTRTDNQSISANAVGSIVNNDALGTINVQVFYRGTIPSLLTPRFITPGIVTVNDSVQTTGSNQFDFSSPLLYRVVSRNNRYVRTYTVIVEFIELSSALPVISSFKFSSALNHSLVQDTTAQISDSAGLIMIEARYGTTIPDFLTPEFSATGLVYTGGAVQTSGFSYHNFTRQVRYTVTNPVNPILTRDYWVQVSLIRDTSSHAVINSFSFHPDENPGLNDELQGRIDHNADKITIFAPVGSGISTTTVIPRFNAAGTVTVNGTIQISGTSGQIFETPLLYKVVSANGINQKEYTVTVRELRSTIYVDQSAAGMGDGTSWHDAFRSLHDGIEAAKLFDEDIPKEIWIAKGTYKPSTTGNRDEYFELVSNTSYIGGFIGTETAKSQRNAEANPVIISGDLGGGVYSNNLYGRYYELDDDGWLVTVPETINGDLVFEDLTFTGARRTIGYGGAAINANLGSGVLLQILNCNFHDLQTTGGALHFNGSGNVEITGTKISSITGIAINTTTLMKITETVIDTVTGNYAIYTNKDLEINNLTLLNITGQGIYSWMGNIDASGIMASNISGRSLYKFGYSESAVINNSTFTFCGDVYIAFSSSVQITNTTITNVHSGIANGLYANSNGNIVLEKVAIDGVPNGRGLYANTSSTTASIWILDSIIKNCTTIAYGGGISLAGSGSAIISDTTIENVEAAWGGGIFYNNSANSFNITINNSVIRNANATAGGGGGGYLNSFGKLVIENSQIENCSATNLGGGLQLVSFGSAEISGTIFENVEATSGGGLYFNSSNMLVIDDSIFLNCKATVNGGGIQLIGSGNANISNTTIENVEAANGGGLYFYSEGTLKIDDSNFKNCIVTNQGGGIQLIGSGNANISNTTIENVEAAWGGGIYRGSNSGNLTLHSTIIKNATAENWSGGLYLAGDAGLTINGNSARRSLFENCRANNTGAIYYNGTNYTITDTDFLNCTASSVVKIAYLRGTGTIQRSSFIHDNELIEYSVPSPDDREHRMLDFNGQAVFEDCIFSNLTSSNSVREVYIFGRWGQYPNPTGLLNNNMNLTLRNCTFNFRTGGKMGLAAMFGGQINADPDYLLMDNVTINSINNQQPIFWFHNVSTSTAGTFRLRPNNYYGTTLLSINNAAVLTPLLTSGVIRLTGGAMPVMVP